MQNEIARIIGCDKSTVSRKLKRNRSKRGYKPKQAQQFKDNRKTNNAPTITEFGWVYITHLLAKKYSSEQIIGRLKKLRWENVPRHETLYKNIYTDKKAGGKLHTHLRSQKKYRKRKTAGQDRRGQIPNRRDGNIKTVSFRNLCK